MWRRCLSYFDDPSCRKGSEDDIAFRQHQSCSSNRWVSKGRQGHRSSWMEVADAGGAAPDIMKLGIEIARERARASAPHKYVLDVKGVITWKYLRARARGMARR